MKYPTQIATSGHGEGRVAVSPLSVAIGLGLPGHFPRPVLSRDDSLGSEVCAH